MENNPYDKLIGSGADPYTNWVADHCGLATNYHNLTHPSAPEYLGATSGYLGGANDCTALQCPDTHNNIFNQLMHSGQTWKAYMESMQQRCYDPATASDPGLNTVGEYDSLHNPPLYYTDLQTGGASSPCMRFDVPMGSPTHGDFARNLATNLPTFSFVTPNKCHDEHNCSIETGDAYLQTLLPVIFNSQYYKQGELLVVLTWDEGEDGVSNNCAYNTTDIGCHVPAIMMSPYTPAHPLGRPVQPLLPAEDDRGAARAAVARSRERREGAFHEDGLRPVTRARHRIRQEAGSHASGFRPPLLLPRPAHARAGPTPARLRSAALGDGGVAASGWPMDRPLTGSK